MSESGRGGTHRRGGGNDARKSRTEPSAVERTVGQLRRLRARIPQNSPLLIRRERLLAEIDAAAGRAAITLIQAPPGYGKTSLLSQWAAGHKDDDVAWLSATAVEDDPALLLANLTESLTHAGVIFDEPGRAPRARSAATPRRAGAPGSDPRSPSPAHAVHRRHPQHHGTIGDRLHRHAHRGNRPRIPHDSDVTPDSGPAHGPPACVRRSCRTRSDDLRFGRKELEEFFPAMDPSICRPKKCRSSSSEPRAGPSDFDWRAWCSANPRAGQRCCPA